jgi:hypothetical protein
MAYSVELLEEIERWRDTGVMPAHDRVDRRHHIESLSWGAAMCVDTGSCGRISPRGVCRSQRIFRLVRSYGSLLSSRSCKFSIPSLSTTLKTLRVVAIGYGIT